MDTSIDEGAALFVVCSAADASGAAAAAAGAAELVYVWLKLLAAAAAAHGCKEGLSRADTSSWLGCCCACAAHPLRAAHLSTSCDSMALVWCWCVGMGVRVEPDDGRRGSIDIGAFRAQLQIQTLSPETSHSQQEREREGQGPQTTVTHSTSALTPLSSLPIHLQQAKPHHLTFLCIPLLAHPIPTQHHNRTNLQ